MTRPRVLVVGGTGQTGPLVVQGLVDRGYEVTLLHGGQHEVPLPPVEHIHADVHFAEPIAEALQGRTFDLAVCMYGRSRLVADELRGRVPRLILVTGAAYAFKEPRLPTWGPFGATVADEGSPFSADKDVDRIGALISASERHILQHQADGHYRVTILRYPTIYGPESNTAFDWTIVRRILDRRPFFIIADGGLRLENKGYRDNVAHALLLAVDQPDVADGQVYNVADDPPVLTMGQWVQGFADALGHSWELVDLPVELVERVYLAQVGYHRVLDTQKIRSELGYADVVPPTDAIAITAHWWAEHGPDMPPIPPGKLADRFDYAAEDELVRNYRAATEHLLAESPPPLEWAHPFRHPKAPGEQWSAELLLQSGAKERSAALEYYPYDLG